MLYNAQIGNCIDSSMSWEQMLFDLYFITMLFTKGLGLTDGPIYKCCIIFGILVVTIKILIGRYNIVERIMLILMALLMLVNWLMSRDMSVLMCLTLALSMKGVRLRHAFSLGAIVWGGTFLIQIATQLLDLRARDFVVHEKFGLGYLIRWALGYSHPNVLQIAYTAFIFYLFYILKPGDTVRLWRDRVFCASVVLAILGVIYIFMYSISSTGMLMFLAFMFCLFYCEWNRRNKRHRTLVETVILQMILPASVIFSVIVPLLLNDSAFAFMNRLLNNRYTLSRYYLQEYGVTLFGRQYLGLPAAVTLDCSYMYLLMHGGGVIFILMIIVYMGCIRATIKEEMSWENSVAIAMLMSVVVGAISEPFAFNTSYKNVSLLLIGTYIYQVTECCGERYPWLSFLDVGNVTPAIADTIVTRIGRIGAYCAHIRLSRRVILTSIVVACAAGILYIQTAVFPNVVYASRSLCDTRDDSVSVYFTEDEYQTMKQDTDIWFLNYRNSDDPMLQLDGDYLIPAEKVRGVVSILVWTGAGSMIVLSITENRRIQSAQ